MHLRGIDTVVEMFEGLAKKVKLLADEFETKLEKFNFNKLSNIDLFRAYIFAGRAANDAVNKYMSGDSSKLYALNKWDVAEQTWAERGYDPIHMRSFYEITEKDVANLEKLPKHNEYSRMWATEIKDGYINGHLSLFSPGIGRVSNQ